MAWEIHGSFSQSNHQTARDRVKLNPLRGSVWMIYAFVISHLLKQGVNVFVPLHQSSLQRQRGWDGARVLEEERKVNQAICPGVPLTSSILWRKLLSPCDSFVNSDLQRGSHRAYVKFWGSAGCKPSFEKWSQHKLGSTALIHTDLDDFIHSHSQSLLMLASVTKLGSCLGSCQMHH